MTREQLDAIRARMETGFLPSWPDLRALLAEVESKVAQNVALMGQNGRLQQEVERLTADPLPAAAWVREVQQAAFARGVAAMREAAMGVCWHSAAMGLYNKIATLPDPEDKS